MMRSSALLGTLCVAIILLCGSAAAAETPDLTDKDEGVWGSVVGTGNLTSAEYSSFLGSQMSTNTLLKKTVPFYGNDSVAVWMPPPDSLTYTTPFGISTDPGSVAIQVLVDVLEVRDCVRPCVHTSHPPLPCSTTADTRRMRILHTTELDLLWFGRNHQRAGGGLDGESVQSVSLRLAGPLTPSHARKSRAADHTTAFLSRALSKWMQGSQDYGPLINQILDLQLPTKREILVRSWEVSCCVRAYVRA